MTQVVNAWPEPAVTLVKCRETHTCPGERLHDRLHAYVRGQDQLNILGSHCNFSFSQCLGVNLELNGCGVPWQHRGENKWFRVFFFLVCLLNILASHHITTVSLRFCNQNFVCTSGGGGWGRGGGGVVCFVCCFYSSVLGRWEFFGEGDGSVILEYS